VERLIGKSISQSHLHPTSRRDLGIPKAQNNKQKKDFYIMCPTISYLMTSYSCMLRGNRGRTRHKSVDFWDDFLHNTVQEASQCKETRQMGRSS